MAKALMRKDLTGQRFGKLTVVRIDEERSRNGKVYWFCKCDCGSEEKSIQSTSLTRKNGGVKSCGCLRNSKAAKEKARETSNKYPKDITGMKFGRLTVLEKTNMKSTKSSDNGAYLWKCQCDCENKTICYYSRYSLITPNGVRSCGCLYNESRHEIGKKYCRYDLDTYNFGIGYCNNGTFFYFDKEDYEKIKNYCWWYDGKYVCAHSLENDRYTTKIVRLHRVVLNIDDREDINVDHKNLIRYDCRKINLRKATDAENARNKDFSYMVSDSGYVGVIKQNNKWLSHIKINGEYIKLGLFENKDDAIIARKQAEEKYFGEFKFDISNKDIIDETNLHLYLNKKCS